MFQFLPCSPLTDAQRLALKKEKEESRWGALLFAWLLGVMCFYLKGMYQLLGLVRSFFGLFALSLSANHVLP